nr:hypothetical protein 3 [bacterium]
MTSQNLIEKTETLALDDLLVLFPKSKLASEINELRLGIVEAEERAEHYRQLLEHYQRSFGDIEDGSEEV